MIQLSFHGAAGTVTGSKYLLTINNRKILIDCGMFQGARELRLRNWQPLPFDPGGVEAVILTHSHIDHIGYLPKMVREGFNGVVFSTPPSEEICRLALLDTAHLQEEDAEFRNKKKLTRHEKALPLFTAEDVESAMRLFEKIDYDEWTRIADGIRFRFQDVGHILGASGVELELNDGHKTVSIFFSGDVGRYGNPLTNNPISPPETDYLVCESTYGGRIHEPEDPEYIFENIIDEVFEKKNILLIPAFAVGRTQQIVYLVNHLIKHNRIPPIDIHIDSPMAISATDIYRKYASYRRTEPDETSNDFDLLESRNIFFHREKKDSQTLNRLRGPAIIISASGMLSGGRILHHMLNRLHDPDLIVALVGFMAEGSLGRKLAEGEKEIYIHKTLVRVAAKIISLHGLSGHADFFELLHWLEPIKNNPIRVFITHGEITQSSAMAEHLQKERNWDCLIPVLGQTVQL
jgi:metallo-beta-lactamase family protein